MNCKNLIGIKAVVVVGDSLLKFVNIDGRWSIEEANKDNAMADGYYLVTDNDSINLMEGLLGDSGLNNPQDLLIEIQNMFGG